MNLKKFGRTEQKVFDMAKPFADKINADIWDVCFEKEGAQWYLRVFIDKENGVSIEDCENLSRPLSNELDEKDPIPQSYMLEVGSAGLERKLLTEKHFLSCIGQKVRVRLIRPLNGEKEIVGVMTAFDKDSFNLNVDSENVAVRLGDAAFVKLYDDFFE